MSMARFPVRSGLTALVISLMVLGPAAPSFAQASRRAVQVAEPEADRFVPFAVTIRTGQSVEWVKRDTDDHTVVSDDAFNTAGHQRTDHLLAGSDSNGGQPGRFTLRFDQPGTFVYFCRFHAHLDASKQPVAPGPRGGI